jgi:hypothetical protein
MNVAFGTLPFGSGLGVQLVMKAITITTTSQALASMNVNEHLFNIMGMAETYVREAYRLFNQDGSRTFQEVMSAYSKVENKPLFWSEVACGAANMALMVYNAKARCFVEGTPVVVGILPPEENVSGQVASGSSSYGVTVLDVLAAVAFVGAVVVRSRKRKRNEEDEDKAMATNVDTVFCDVQMLDELDEPSAREPSRTELSTEWLKSNELEIGTSNQLNGSMPSEKMVLAPNRIKHSKWSKSLPMIGLMFLALLCASPRLVQLFGDRDAVSSVGLTNADLLTSPSKARLLTKPIEEIRCGDRIPSELPDGLFPEDEPEPDQATWRLIELELTKANGDKVEVKLLRPLAWLEQAGAITEGVFDVKVKELDIEGKAAVLQILPCPPIQGGEGQVVTGTFRHTSDSLVELQIEGEPDPIICTSGHLIWSEDRGEFVRAAELRMGEGLRLALRKSRLQSRNRICSERVVRNIEVAQTHVYMVGAQGILVHNAGASCDDDPGSSDREAKDRLVLGRGTPDKLADVAEAVGGRVINNPAVTRNPRALWKHIYGEMRKADEIVQVVDDIPTKQIGGRGSGEWARAEKIFIDSMDELFKKTRRIRRSELGLE